MPHGSKLKMPKKKKRHPSSNPQVFNKKLYNVESVNKNIFREKRKFEVHMDFKPKS